MRRTLLILVLLAGQAAPAPLSRVVVAQPGTPTRQTLLEEFARAYYPGRTGDIIIVPREGHFITRRDPAVKFMHGSPWPYDTRIPFFFYGPAFIKQGTFPQVVGQQDMAPTLALLLGVPMPATSSGRAQAAVVSLSKIRPRIILLGVLDGMRVDYFDRHAAVMPTFDRLRRQGAWFGNARIDTLPSITAVGHATVATGARPNMHGIVANAIFDRATGTAADAYPGLSPRNLMALTLSDVWNLHTNGEAVIIGQGTVGRAAMPLAGHGACQVNGHRVIAVSYNAETGNWDSNTDCYNMPGYLKGENARTVWEETGGQWMGHSIANPNDVRGSAPFSKFETRALISMIEHEPLGSDEVTDLVSVNFKTPDYVGHRYGPDSAELREAVAALDGDLARVLAALDAKVGRDRYVVAFTADHGMPPEPDVRRGHERHYAEDLVNAIHQKFDPAGRLVKSYEPENGQIAIDRRRLGELGLDLAAIATFVQAQPFMFAAYTQQEVANATAHAR